MFPYVARAVPTQFAPVVRAGAVVALVGAVLSIIGSFGTWIHIAIPFESFDASGFSNGRDGPYVLVLATVISGLAVWQFVAVRAPYWLGWIVLSVALFVCLAAVADAIDIHHHLHTPVLERAGIQAGIGWGLWLAVAGASTSVVGGVLSLLRRNQ
jgi:hypothetical protein